MKPENIDEALLPEDDQSIEFLPKCQDLDVARLCGLRFLTTSGGSSRLWCKRHGDILGSDATLAERA